jgi:hypothetical protein
VIFRVLAIGNQTVPKPSATSSSSTLTQHAHLLLASATFILGRFKSSFSRWLCSVSRRSFSSDMDCLCGRAAFIVGGRARK